MATFNNGWNGFLSGAVGPMVYYVSRGRQCVRSRAAARNPRTAAQQAGRRAFGAVAHLAGRMRYALRDGLSGEAARLRSTVQGLFVGMNRAAVEVTAQGTAVDYSRLRLSAGPLAAPLFGAVERHEGEGATVLTVAARRAPEGLNGLFVHLYAYCPALDRGVGAAPATLSSGAAALRIPSDMAAEGVHLYAFARNYNGDASPTVYLGWVDMQSDTHVTDSTTPAARRSPSPDSGEEPSYLPASQETGCETSSVLGTPSKTRGGGSRLRLTGACDRLTGAYDREGGSVWSWETIKKEGFHADALLGCYSHLHCGRRGIVTS